MAISAPNVIGENSAATPGLWNSIVTQLWANDLSLSGGTFGTSSNTLTPESGNTITVLANDFVTNYVYASTPQTTPTAFAATQLRGFVSTVYGAVMMGFGTTADVTLMNRAGTAVLTIGPNATYATTPTGLVISATDPSALYAAGVAGPSTTFPLHFIRAAAGPTMLIARVNTSFAAPSALVNNDVLGGISMGGYNGTTLVGGPGVNGIATETWSGTARGSKLAFIVRANTTTTAATALTLGQDSSATFASNITQSAGTAALQAITGTTLIGSDATDATNSTSGAFKTAGGMGIAKKLFVGTSLTVGTGFGCNAAAAQTAYASGGALNAYGAGANGFDTGANASALHALVVNIRAALVANGVMS